MHYSNTHNSSRSSLTITTFPLHSVEQIDSEQLPFSAPPQPMRLLPQIQPVVDQRPNHLRHVLVLDDDISGRDALANFLRHRDFRVWVATTPAEAVAMITYRLPDILLLEVALPGTNGLDFIRQLRHQRATTLMPIIITSVHNTTYDIRTGLAIGADDYITKPLELSIVEARINALLRREMRLRATLASTSPAPAEAKVMHTSTPVIPK
jgi:CheY-like chemotaxis protein